MSSAATTMPGRTWQSTNPPKAKPPQSTRNPDEEIRLANQPLTAHEEPRRSGQYAPEYDTDKPGGNIFQGRAFNTFRRDDERAEKRDEFEKQDEEKKVKVKFSEKEPDPETGGREMVVTSVGGVTVKTTKPYEVILAERDALLETDHSYRKRLQELEAENIQMLTDYDSIYKENQLLREKLERGDETHIESYQRIYADRQILREAETAYKKRISQLEIQAKEMLTNFESLHAENRILRDKGRKLEDKLNAIDKLDDVKKMNELEKKVKQLEKQIRLMGYEKEGIQKEKYEIENQMLKLQEDVADLNKRNITLERENEAFRRGFMALGQNEDNKWKNDQGTRRKTTREEEEERLIKEENREFRTKVETLRNEKMETDKKNVALTTKITLLEKDKAEFERKMLDFLREQNKRTPSAVKRMQEEAADMAKKKIEELSLKIEDMTKENVEIKTKITIADKENNELKGKLEAASNIKRESSSSIKRKVQNERDIEDLKKMIGVMSETSEKYESKISMLQNTINDLEQQLKAEKKAQKAKLTEKVEQLDEKVKDLQLQLIEVNSENKRITDEDNRLKEDYYKLRDELETKINKLEREKEVLEEQSSSFAKNANAADSENLEKINQLKDELNAVQVELNILKPKYESQETELDRLNVDNATLTESLSTTKSQLEDALKAMKDEKDLFNKLTHVERERIALKQERDDMEKRFIDERDKLEKDLEELLKNQEFMNTGLAEHRVRLDMIQDEKSDLKSENMKLVKANERQSKIITDLASEIDKIKNDGSAVTKTLNDEVKALTERLKSSETEVIKCQKELETVTNEKENQVNKLIRQLNKLKAEREVETQQLKDQSDSLRAEIARLKVFEDRIAGMEGDLKEFISRLQETEAKNKSLTETRLASLGQVVTEMKSENLANRLRAAESEQNEIEKQKLELEIKQDAVHEIRKLKEENVRLRGLLDDKRAAEEAQDEWTKRRNKYNEVVAQNKRFETENKRLLSLYENSNADKLRQDLQDKTEKLKVIEAGYNRFNAENARLRQIMEEKEAEMKMLNGQINRGKSIQEQNKKLVSEMNRLHADISKKDNIIIQLKQFEASNQKYQDIAANNTRLYEENRRLRDTLENKEDKKPESYQEKEAARDIAARHAKIAEENEILKREIEAKLREKNRELEVQTDIASNMKARNKRLQEEVKRLRDELNEKNGRLVQLHDLETTSEKFKYLEEKNARLYDENQRLRTLLENTGQKKKLDTIGNVEVKEEYKDKRQEQWAVYVDKSQTKTSTNVSEEIKTSAMKGKKLPKRRNSANGMQLESPTLNATSQIGNKLQIKSLLPDIEAKNKSSYVGTSNTNMSTAKLRAQQRVKALA